jgi:hypothetical protein
MRLTRNLAVVSGWILLAATIGFTESFAASSIANEPTRPRRLSIPLPGGSMYMPEGLVGVFGGGRMRDLNESLSLYQWQGEVSYAYKPWMSAGVGFRIKAGEPNSEQQKVENRYFGQVRFHKAFRKVDLYAGPQIGVDDLNLTESTPDSTGENLLSETFSKIGAGLGLEFGLGYKPFPWGGITLGHRFEWSLGNLTALTPDASQTFNFRAFPGLNVDLLHWMPALGKSVHAFYLFVEAQSGYSFVVGDRRRVETALVGGGALGF